MNEVQLHAMEEQSNAATALLEELNEWCGLEGESLERIARAIYKGTDCGAWIAIDDEGLKVGSIVEGSDAECETHTLDWVSYLRMEEGGLRAWLNSALEEIEEEADFLWREANLEETEEIR